MSSLTPEVAALPDRWRPRDSNGFEGFDDGNSPLEDSGCNQTPAMADKKF
jgi:hypothetical protein